MKKIDQQLLYVFTGILLSVICCSLKAAPAKVVIPVLMLLAASAFITQTLSLFIYSKQLTSKK